MVGNDVTDSAFLTLKSEVLEFLELSPSPLAKLMLFRYHAVCEDMAAIAAAEAAKPEEEPAKAEKLG